MKPSLHAAWLWYRGGCFHGFQRQPGLRTVQGELGRTLSSLGGTGEPMPAGRTDRGAHARMQVVRCRLEEGAQWEDARWPEDLGVVATAPVPKGFQPQWHCVGKEYRYRVSLHGQVPEAWRGYCWDALASPRLAQSKAIDPERVAELLALAVGTRDFRSFHEASSATKPRSVWNADWRERGGGVYEVSVRGDHFARHQVRFMVGAAVGEAAGVLAPGSFQAGLEGKGTLHEIKAPGAGLVLWEVLYPPERDPFDGPLREAAPSLPARPPFL